MSQLRIALMNFTQLKAFYNVAKNKSFTKAAHELNVTQSTLSRQVQDFEKYYKITLFKRTQKAIELTAEGDIIYSFAKKIFSITREMENTLEDFNISELGGLKIGSNPLFARYLLPDIIFSLKKRNPQIKLKLYTHPSKEILRKVNDFEYHVGVVRRVSYDGDIICKQISKQKLFFITKDDLGDKIYLKDLSNYPLILAESGSPSLEYIIDEFNKRNIPLNSYIESENPSAIKKMIQLGLGGGFFPSFCIEEDVKQGKFRKIEILDDLHFFIDVIYLSERRKSIAIESFISEIKRYPINTT